MTRGRRAARGLEVGALLLVPTPRFLVLLLGVTILVGCTAGTRQISGTLVQARTGVPVAGQVLALDRPPGNYPPFLAMIAIPEQTTIAQARTDGHGHFEFITRKDKDRHLSIHLAGERVTSPLLSASDLAVVRLRDSRSPLNVSFDDELVDDEHHRWHLRPWSPR